MTDKAESPPTTASAFDLGKMAEWVAEQRAGEATPLDPYERYFGRLMSQEAVNGDESFGKAAATHLLKQLVSGRLDDYDTGALVVMLRRLIDSPSSIKAVCGVPNRTGQHRRGYLGLRLAIETSAYIRQKGASLEQAATAIGRQHSLSPSAIKGHWRERKGQVLAALREHAVTLYPEASSGQLDAVARVVLLGEKAATPEDLETIRPLATPQKDGIA
jgi:hypothetical protein